MKQSIAGHWADRYPPEKPKFKCALLLVHGLWTGPSSWQSWATHFCNLGWDCVAVDLRRRSAPDPATHLRRLSFDDCVSDLGDVIRSFSTPPVLLAMNLGALMALKALEHSKLTALILVSPSVPGNFDVARSRLQRLLWIKYRLLIFLRRPIRIDQKDFRNNFLTLLPEHLQIAISNETAPESSMVVREFLRPRVQLEFRSLSCPLLVVAGAEDELTPASTSNKMAQWLGGEFREYGRRGHWLIEDDGEPIVRDLHRWIVQQQGEKILLADPSCPPS
jgi:pimeloyl-ACP methyl ester carboxylesterase